MSFYDIDTQKMSFTDAIAFSTLTGKSFTCERWSAESQNSIQMYVYKKKLYCQNYNQKSELMKMISGQKLNDSYVIYERDFEQYHKTLDKDKKRLEELRIEIEPLYSKFKEYSELLAKLNTDEDDF